MRERFEDAIKNMRKEGIKMKLVARKAEVKQVERRGKEIQGVDLQGSSLMRLMMTGNLRCPDQHLS